MAGGGENKSQLLNGLDSVVVLPPTTTLYMAKNGKRIPACLKKGNNMKPFTIEDAEDYIYLDKQGSIVVESVFAKGFKGDLKLLLSCVEEHIVCDKLGNESINWHTARID